MVINNLNYIGKFFFSKLDYSLFTNKLNGEIVVLLIYVDDLVISGDNRILIAELKDTLMTNFKMKDLGDLKFFLGIEIARSSKGLVFSQRKYALEIISDLGLSTCKHVMTPMEHNYKLTSKSYD